VRQPEGCTWARAQGLNHEAKSVRIYDVIRIDVLEILSCGELRCTHSVPIIAEVEWVRKESYSVVLGSEVSRNRGRSISRRIIDDDDLKIAPAGCEDT
jgi:hypothetical protein